MSKPNGKTPPRRDTFLRLSHRLLASMAWKECNPNARVLYVEIGARFNGYNNGAIPFSRREASQQLRIRAAKAVQAFADLQAAGLIVATRKGWNSGNFRQATLWFLPHLTPTNGSQAEPVVGSQAEPVGNGSPVEPVTGSQAEPVTAVPRRNRS